MTSVVRVSIVIAAFEAETYLDRAIDSARAQTLKDIEIIIVDDASGDGTAAVAQRHAELDPRVTVLTLKTNGGPGSARNAGLCLARGDWIAMLDADDAFTPERLAILTARGDAEGSDMIADNLTLLYPGKPPERLLPLEGPWPLRPTAVSFVAGNRGAWGQDRVLLGFLKPLIRRAFLIDHSLRYRTLRLAEDYFLYLEALLAGAAWLVVPESFYTYTVRQDSLTARFEPEELDAMAAVDGRILIEAHGGLSRAEAAAIASHRNDVLGAAAWTRMVGAFRRKDASALLRALPRRPAIWGVVISKMAGSIPRVWARLKTHRGR